MFLKAIPVLKDNYAWVIYNKSYHCIIVDPGQSDIIIQFIEKNKLIPIAILLTHNHSDHVNGIKEIKKRYSKISIFSPRDVKKNKLNKTITKYNKIRILNKEILNFHTPGHTSEHVAYYIKPYMFCGDTLFSGGCGRVYNKQYLKLFNSIKLISSFPRETLLCCGHEYTLSNIIFSMSILPNDKNIQMYYKKIKQIISSNKPTLPVYLYHEKLINLFLRTDQNVVKKAINSKITDTPLDIFIKLRLKKDHFNEKKYLELSGIEPLTSCVQGRRSPS